MAQEDYCPICWINFKKREGSYQSHRCNNEVLRGINAAHTNANINDFFMSELHEKVFGNRLYEGFLMSEFYEREDEGGKFKDGKETNRTKN